MTTPAAPPLSNSISIERPTDWHEWFTSEDQVREWEHLCEQIVALERMVVDLKLTGEQQQSIADAFAHAWRHLEYKRPYVISVVGVAGAGKSTLINSLLGRDIVVFKYGRPTTGTIVSIRSIGSLSTNQPVKERALIHYYSRERLAQAATMMQNLAASSSASPEVVTTLEDLLAAAKLHGEKLELEGPEIRELNSLKDFQDLFELMDDASPRNRDPNTRIIPIIERIELEIAAPAWARQDKLARIVLTDVPGADARNVMHEQHLREQLTWSKTDAVIMVLPPQRPEQGSSKLQTLIENVYAGLSDNHREAAMDGLFLVVSKHDVRHGIDPDEAERNVQANVDDVAKAFSPFKPLSHVFTRVKALPALIAQLIQLDRESGDAWLAGQDIERFKYLKLSLDHYLQIRSEAKQKTGLSDAEQAVLQISGIPELRKALNEFIGFSRWDRELGAARVFYTNAHQKIADIILKEWEKISGGKVLGVTIDDDLSLIANNEDRIFSERANQEVDEILRRFDLACEKLAARNIERAITEQISVVLSDIQSKIKETTGSAPFGMALVGSSTHPFRRKKYRQIGAPEPLIKLDKQVTDWFDDEAGKIAIRMSQLLREELNRANVESELAKLCQEPNYQRYLVNYRKNIVDALDKQFAESCRGAILYQILQDDVIQKFIQAQQDFGRIIMETNSVAGDGANGSPSRTRDDTLITNIRELYRSTHQNLIQILPSLLSQLFLYHLTRAQDNMHGIINEDLRWQLLGDVKNSNSAVYQRIRAQSPSLTDRAQTLKEHWMLLQSLGNA